ncbi:hypothetical protein [Pantoea sp. SS70]|uniref:hypothetical protein n=1 Tax=Pantoea sp. SS70 TaxID=3024247 RepID=UPI0024529BB9|nr:hypothetical protein [Pantoea sp. SS70]WGK60066.1 hypothetical protein PO881_23255 [Pantoea sp. SS70]
MVLNEFMQKVSRWPQLHFTAIECEQRGAAFEIYATDCTSQTRSRLLMYRTPDAQDAGTMASHFRLWLGKANRGRNSRQKKAFLSGASRAG